MKWLVVVAVVLVGGGFFLSEPVAAETADLVEIQDIVHSFDSDGNEIVSFHLDDPVRPKIFAIYGDKPRLVIDFPGTVYRGKNVVKLDDGKLASGIRSGWHKEPTAKTRVVIDIRQGPKFRFEKATAESDKVLVVTLFPSGSGVEETTARTAVATTEERMEGEKKIPDRAVLESMPLEKKPIPPAFASKEISQDELAALEAEVEDGTARLLKITFDNSSNRGEMVLFHLNDFYPPTVSAVEKTTPRVVCDFDDMTISPSLETNLFANGKYVERVRTTAHKGGKVQVVLELSPERDYDLQQVFFKNDNLFVLIVNELQSEEKEESR